jgi:transcriptional regulator with XRE-family HTH domain
MLPKGAAPGQESGLRGVTFQNEAARVGDPPEPALFVPEGFNTPSMDTEADRYNIIQERSELNKKDFAARLGLSKAMGFQISTGRLKPSREVMERLSELFGVNLNWFISGRGPSGMDDNMAEIELLDQEAAAGRVVACVHRV